MNFFKAIVFGDVPEAKFLDAAKRGSLANMRHLIISGELNVNCQTPEDSSTALSLACFNSHEPVVKYLLSVPGINVNLPRADGATPFFLACQANNPGIVQLLLQNPAVDLGKKTNDGVTPLQMVISGALVEIMVLLLTSEREEEFGGEDVTTPLRDLYSGKHPKFQTCWDFLNKFRARQEERNKEGEKLEKQRSKVQQEQRRLQELENEKQLKAEEAKKQEQRRLENEKLAQQRLELLEKQRLQNIEDARLEKERAAAEALAKRKAMLEERIEAFRGSDLSKCPLCGLAFKDPRTLACFHTFCFSCLETKAAKADGSSCDVCGFEVDLSGGALSQLKPGSFATSLLRSSAHEITDPNNASCEGCEEAAIVFCSECSQYLGAQCAVAHKRLKITSSHTLMPLEELFAGSPSASSIAKVANCTAHSHLEVDTYCTTCKETVCTKCAVEQHPSHAFRPLKDEARRAEEDTKVLLLSLLFKMDAAQKSVSKFESSFEVNSRLLNEAENNIRQTFASLHLQLENRQAELIQHLQAQANILKDQNFQKMGTSERGYNEIKGFCDFGSGLLAKGTYADLVLSQSKVGQRGEALQKWKIPEPSPSKSLNFVPSNIKEATKVISNVGFVSGQVKQAADPNPPPSTIVVLNLPFSVTAEDLLNLFEPFNPSDSHTLKGYGFVDFETPLLAESAAETMDGYELDGRVLTVQISEGRKYGSEAGSSPQRSQKEQARVTQRRQGSKDPASREHTPENPSVGKQPSSDDAPNQNQIPPTKDQKKAAHEALLQHQQLKKAQKLALQQAQQQAQQQRAQQQQQAQQAQQQQQAQRAQQQQQQQQAQQQAQQQQAQRAQQQAQQAQRQAQRAQQLQQAHQNEPEEQPEQKQQKPRRQRQHQPKDKQGSD